MMITAAELIILPHYCQRINKIFIFNIFSNIFLLLLVKKCHVFNYADDTNILCKHRDYDSAYKDLLSAANTMIHW